ncbi:hypothetical protein PE067_16055 [Paracoccus sp. DMF-8]|uniref:hypothetical protein n=1 Tax=Paracoccus sp. DMF-8 TaxID=3019445 RepID=UPI0023E43FF9|nr:hypothetical protein [Paracoccus sp. DMF-8]MDF3607521.1 hypothetical protein [Paracoccus sp. DMF-8]
MITADELLSSLDRSAMAARILENAEFLTRKLIAAADVVQAAERLADSAQLEWGNDWPEGADPISALREAITAYREVTK